MKKTFKLSIIISCCFCLFFCCGCSSSTQTLAKDLDTTVKNFVYIVSSLDWPDDAALDEIDSIDTTTNDDDNLAATSAALFAKRETEPLQLLVDDQTEQSGFVVNTSIDTTELFGWIDSVKNKINIMLAKRADLLLYINEIYSDNVNLTDDDIMSIKVYMNIIKDNSTYLNSYKGMLKNQINEALTLLNENRNTNIINAYIIKAVETLQIRAAKLDTSILAMNSIVDIIDSKLITNIYSIRSTQPTPKTDTPIESPNDSNVEESPSIAEPTEGEQTITEDPSTVQEQETLQNNQPTQEPEQNETEEPELEPEQPRTADAEAEQNNSIETQNNQNALNFDSQTLEVQGDANTSGPQPSNGTITEQGGAEETLSQNGTISFADKWIDEPETEQIKANSKTEIAKTEATQTAEAEAAEAATEAIQTAKAKAAEEDTNKEPENKEKKISREIYKEKVI